MITVGKDGVLTFGEEYQNLKEELQPEYQVYTKEVLRQTFPFQIKITLKDSGNEHIKKSSQTLLRNLNFHYCNSLHRDITKEQMSKFEELESFDKDERIFFVKED